MLVQADYGSYKKDRKEPQISTEKTNSSQKLRIHRATKLIK